MPSAAFLRRLREKRDELAKPDGSGASARTSEDLADGPVLDVRADLVAVLLYSKLLDREVWLCRDERAAGEIAAEHPDVPTFTFSEISHLRGKPPELLNAILNAKIVFPGADSRLRA